MEIAKILDLSPSGRDAADSSGAESQSEEAHQQHQHQQQLLLLQQHEQHQRLLLQEEMCELSGSLNQIRRDLELAAKACDDQTKKMDSYNRELDTLQQERLVHVQQLRSLHADINSLEGSLKRSEQTRQRELNRARSLMERYAGLLARVNRLRMLCNLEPLEDCGVGGDCGVVGIGSSTENISKQLPLPLLPPPLLQTQHQQHQPPLPPPPFLAAFSPFLPPFHPSAQLLSPSVFGAPPPLPQPPPPPPTVQSSSPIHHLANHNPHQQHHHRHSSSSAIQQQQHHPVPPLPHQPHQLLTGNLPQQSLGPVSSFQQQPPPMKACLSCHQQIHRNAPICPLCKAKSRSKHPKKQKRKADD